MIKVAPSLLSADFGNLQEELAAIEKAGADYVHFDVMDGRFVPNLSFGIPVLKGIKKYTSLPFDVHLMIEQPDHLIKGFVDAGADLVTVHAESVYHLHRSIQLIKENGVGAGVSLNPGSPLSMIEEVLGDVDLVLLMSVNPGFGGQAFIEATKDKIKRLAEMRRKHGYDFLIEVDGGVSPKNARVLEELGVDILVAGSAVFNGDDYQGTIAALKG